MNVAGIILCGGRSSRMGKPKAWLPVGAELMLPRVVRIVREAVESVIVVAAPDQDVPPLPADVLIVRDEVEGRGPLGGLAAGLAALEGKVGAVYLSSCDVPLLKSEFVRRVMEWLTPEEPTPPSPLKGQEPTPPVRPSLKGGGVNSGTASSDSSDATELRGLSPPSLQGGGLGGRFLAFEGNR